MVKKGIELVGISEKNVTDAVRMAVKEAAATIKGLEWIKIIDYSLKVEDGKIYQHQVRLKAYFEVKR